MEKKVCPYCGKKISGQKTEKTEPLDKTSVYLLLTLFGVMVALFLAIPAFEDAGYNYPHISGLTPDEVAGVKAGYRAGFEDGITNTTTGNEIPVGCSWGYGYYYGWTDGHEEYLKRSKK
jgi:hypothetical protein